MDASRTDAGPGAADPAGFVEAGMLSVARNALTATVLRDGRVLLVGGENVDTRTPLDAVDVFDPRTNELRPAAPLPAPRSNHEAVLLDDGRVLVLGGGRSAPVGAGSGEGVTASAILYDPERDAWEETGSLAEARSHFAATRLPDGRVLVAGGTAGTYENAGTCTGAANCGSLGDTLGTAEIFDPASGTFSPAGSLATARTLFTLEVLDDGRVLAIAGMNDARQGFSSTEIFDPTTAAWSLGPSLASEARIFHASARLPSGRILVGGGKLPDTYFLASVDIVDVDAGEARSVSDLGIAQTLPRFVELDSGGVLAVGGFRCPRPCEPIAEAQIYREDTGAWQPIGSLLRARAGHAAVRLHDGRVLVCGGFTAAGNTATCELSSDEDR